jgi:hypothetical protein
MEENKPKNYRSFFGIVLFIVFVYFLFTLDIKSLFNSPKFQNNITFIEDKVDYFWNQVIIKKTKYLWDEVFSKRYVNIESSDVNNILNLDKISEQLDKINNKKE